MFGTQGFRKGNKAAADLIQRLKADPEGGLEDRFCPTDVLLKQDETSDVPSFCC